MPHPRGGGARDARARRRRSRRRPAGLHADRSEPHRSRRSSTRSPDPAGNHLVWLAPDGRVASASCSCSCRPVARPTSRRSSPSSAAWPGGSATTRSSLAYRNEAPIAAPPTANPPGCGPAERARTAEPTCAIDVRTEILDRRARSRRVVERQSRQQHREPPQQAARLPDGHRPPTTAGGSSSTPIGPNPQPVWSKTVIAGSSLGAGEAAMIAATHDVYRAALLHGWVDAAHGWVNDDSRRRRPRRTTSR